MSTTIGDILLSVAYRRGEDALPNDANESQRRLLSAAEAYRKVCQANLYWFLQTNKADTSTDDKNRYPLWADFKEMIEVRVNNIVRTPIADFQAHNEYSYPSNNFNYVNNWCDKNYYIEGNEIVFLPATNSSPSSFALTVSSSGIIATAVSSTPHGLQNDDYVTISGCATAVYNGQFVVTVTNSTTFTYTIATTTGSSSGTGIFNNIRYKYYLRPAKITSLNDVVLIPDEYADIITAYVCGRLSQLDGEKGDAADYFAEFEEIKMEMNRENLRRGIYGHSINSSFIK